MQHISNYLKSYQPNKLATEVFENKKAVEELPKCPICKHFTTSMEIHMRVAHPNETI